MEKVVTINLGGKAYQLEERGYQQLAAYLEAAGAKLKDNPDCAEILGDLERAIAEKCEATLHAGKTVVLGAEIETIIAAMGPVEDGAGAEKAAQTQAPPQTAPHKRLYRVREGGWIAGVCNGFAAYFDIDVTIMRVLFVILALITHGFALLIYIIMMFVIPTARTAEEFAAARGEAFSAQDLVDQAKARYAEFTDRGRWSWKGPRSAPRPSQRAAHIDPLLHNPPAGYGGQILAGLAAPIFALLSAVIALAMIAALVSLMTTGALLGWPLPAGVPLWGALLIVVILYNTIVWPLRAVRRASYHALGGDRGWFDAWDGVLVLGFMLFIGWMAYQYLPSVHAAVNALPELWRDPARYNRFFFNP